MFEAGKMYKSHMNSSESEKTIAECLFATQDTVVFKARGFEFCHRVPYARDYLKFREYKEPVILIGYVPVIKYREEPLPVLSSSTYPTKDVCLSPGRSVIDWIEVKYEVK